MTEDEMGGACCTYGGEEKCEHMVLWGNLKESDSLEARIRWYDNITWDDNIRWYRG
jgi:hypothetical protein